MECLLGVNIAAGVAYLGVVNCPSELLISDEVESMALAKNLGPAEMVDDLRKRFREELRRLRPLAVGVVHPRLYSGWKYRDAYTRVTIETAIMVAAVEEQIHFASIKQDKIAGVVKAPVGATFAALAAKRLGLQKVPSGWNNRALAFGAALLLSQEQCDEGA